MNTFERLTEKCKISLAKFGTEYPNQYKEIIAELEAQEYYTEVRYYTASEVARICELKSFTDAFPSY
mgnify:FL=1|tara:strand:- start:2625 stop:2825 length:201 start_codon:yes stop_codon:yes gene_type:complete